MKVGYSKTYPIPVTGEWEKIWVEEDFEGTLEDARKRWYAIKKEVENFHFESNKAAEKQVIASPENEEAKTIAEIFLCPDLVTLKTYDVVSKKHKAVRTAYIQKLNQLNNKSQVELP